MPFARTREMPSPSLEKGFRPFFLLGALFAIVMVPLWLLVLFGIVQLNGRLDPVTWHAHEMVFGFGGAIVAGFLLTAVGNWTRRETAVGGHLLLLVGLWLAGRFTTIADIVFLPAVALAIARPLVRTHNRRNYVVVVMLLLLSAANVWVHLGGGRRALLAGVDIVTFFMVVITGRVVPMFTRNATARTTVRSLPKLDVVAALSIVAVAVIDALAVESPALRLAVFASAAVFVAARAMHWGARAASRVPLLFILHVGHAWIAIGLALRAAAAITGLVPSSLGLHALTAGAIGSLTIGMMARVALGHTGRALVAPRAATIAFALVTIAAIARVVVPLVAPGAYLTALVVAAIAWSTAFALYAASYARILVSPRIDAT